MVKFIDFWMFATHIWRDSSSSPTVINLRDITHIDERYDDHLGTHVVVYLKMKMQYQLKVISLMF